MGEGREEGGKKEVELEVAEVEEVEVLLLELPLEEEEPRHQEQQLKKKKAPPLLLLLPASR